MAKTPSTGKLPGKTVLTRHLKELAGSLSERICDKDGHALTKAEALAAVIWDRALGWVEVKDDGTKVPHSPEPWAVALVFERMEGRAPTAQDVGGNKGTVADRVSELGKTKINALSALTPEAPDGQPE